MKIYVIRDGVFTLHNGEPASNLIHYEGFAKRYLASFSEVVMVGRLFQKEDPSAKPVCGPNVTFKALPGYHGPLGFVKNLPALLKTIWQNVEPGSAYVLRIPATLPSIYAFILWLRRIPFAVEVAADPYDSYSKKALNNHPLGPVFQWLFVSLTKWQCRHAAACAYVTREALQRRYPPRTTAGSFAFTSLDLTPECYVNTPRPQKAFTFGKRIPHLVLTGNMHQSWKGHDTLLEAMKMLKEQGISLRLTVIGYGNNQPVYAKMAEDFGLGDAITFTGKLAAGEAVRTVLDTADLFVLPSRQEGLPRALLEAMARSLPAIATRVGGTPELLGEEALIDPDAPAQLAERLAAFLQDPALLSAQSKRNLQIAQTYAIDIVSKERQAFYEYLISQSNR